MAFVFAPDGTPGVIPDEQLDQAVREGYVLRKPSVQEATKAQAESSPFIAAGESVLRGVTAGVSDPILKRLYAGLEDKTPEVAAEVIKARKEENPIISTVGELGGAIGTSIATGGASAFVGGGIKGAAFEGGLYGMGSVVSESALENTELTAERLGAGLVGGALVSGGISTALTGVSKGASLALSKFGGKGLKNTLEEAAYKMEERALAEAQQGAVKRLKSSGGSLRDVVEYARENDIPIEFNEQTLKSAKQLLADTGNETQLFVGMLDDVTPLNQERNRARLVDTVSNALKQRFKDDPLELREAAKFMDDQIIPLLFDDANATWKRAYSIQSGLRNAVSNLSDTSIKKDVYNVGRKALRDAIFDEASSINPGVKEQLQRLQKDYAKGAYLVSAIETRILKNESVGGWTGAGMMDVIRGGGLGGTVGGAVAGPVGASLGSIAGVYANKAMREKGAAIGANALRSLASSKITNGVSNGLSQRLRQALSIAPEVFGAYRYPIARAAAQGADALVNEHVRLASGPYGQDYLARTGLPVESADEVVATGRKLALLDAIQMHSDARDQEVNSAVEGLFGGAPGRRASIGTSMSSKEFAKVREELLADTSQPERVFEQVPGELRAAAPSTLTQAAAVALRGKQFLLSKAPRSPFEGVPVAVAPPWQPSAADLDKFTQYKEAVEQPAKVLKNLAQGYVSPEQIEAVKAVYPAMYADLQQKIGERLAVYNKPLTFQQKLAFTAILGPAALGMTPQQIQVIQQSQALAVNTNSRQGSPRRPDGRQDVNEAQIQTEAQKLEART